MWFMKLCTPFDFIYSFCVQDSCFIYIICIIIFFPHKTMAFHPMEIFRNSYFVVVSSEIFRFSISFIWNICYRWKCCAWYGTIECLLFAYVPVLVPIPKPVCANSNVHVVFNLISFHFFCKNKRPMRLGTTQQTNGKPWYHIHERIAAMAVYRMYVSHLNDFNSSSKIILDTWTMHTYKISQNVTWLSNFQIV